MEIKRKARAFRNCLIALILSNQKATDTNPKLHFENLEDCKMFKGIQLYENFLDSFSDYSKTAYDSSSLDVSINLFKDWFAMHSATWKHSLDSKRDTRLALADIFQDIVAHYLNKFLPDGYHAFPEHTIQNSPKLQVDIVIKKDGRIIFLIELKTTLGYDRGSVVKTNDVTELKVYKRRQQIADACGIDKKNVIFILASFGNVSRLFAEQYWIKSNSSNNGSPVDVDKRSKDEPYSFIYPLFDGYDPRYMKNMDPYKKYNNQELIVLAQKNLCTPFEHILDLICNAE